MTVNRTKLTTRWMKRVSQALLVAFLMVGLSTSALAQEHVEKYNQALEIAKEGQAAQQASNVDLAVTKYTESYELFMSVVDLAQGAGEGAVAQRARGMAARIAYQAGAVLNNNGRKEEAIDHFERGMQFDPTYPRNMQARDTALNSLNQGVFVEASAALNAGNARQTITLLADADEANFKTHFYRALAYQALRDAQNTISSGQMALDASGGTRTNRGLIELAMGEAYIQLGNVPSARTHLGNAGQMGDSQTRNRARALLDQIGSGTQ